jgi:hypothetical protein
MGIIANDAVRGLIALLRERSDEEKLLIIQEVAGDLLKRHERIEISNKAGETIGCVKPALAAGEVEVSPALAAELEERRRTANIWVRAEDVLPHLESLTR